MFLPIVLLAVGERASQRNEWAPQLPPQSRSAQDMRETMGKLIFILGLLFLFLAQPPVSYGSVSDYWVTQSGAGAQNGTSPANAAPWQNLANNSTCSTNGGPVGPGTVVHLSGTFNVPENTTGLVWMNCSGGAGNKIWLKFEPGTVCQSPQFGWSLGNTAGGCIQVNNVNYIRVGGATPCGTTTGGVDSPATCDGTIQNTAFGTAYPIPPTGTQATTGFLSFYNCKGCEISGLAIINAYVIAAPWQISSATWTGGGAGTVVCANQCPVGTGIVIVIGGNSSVPVSTYLTVTGQVNGTTFTVKGGPTGGGATGGTAYDESQSFQQNASNAIVFVNVYATCTTSAPGVNNCWDASIHDNVIHDCDWCIFAAPTQTGTGLRINNNQIYNFEHGWFAGPGDNVNGTGPIVIDDNHFHDTYMWEDGPALDNFHTDPIHAQVDQSTNPQYFFANFTIFNNVFDGNMNGSTNYIFFRASSKNTLMFNNVFGCSSGFTWENYIISIGDETNWAGRSFTTSPAFYNNTVTCTQVFQGPSGAIHFNNNGGVRSPTNGIYQVTEENNIWQNGRTVVGYDLGGSYTSVDYNVVEAVCADTGSGCTGWTRPFGGPLTGVYASCANAKSCDAGAGSTTPTLQTELGSPCLSGACALHSLVARSSSINLSSNGMPKSGSVAIGAGLNLSNICSGAAWPLSQLCYDNVGNQRNGGGPWDAGAFYSGSEPPQPAAPTGLTATVE
jgi:hypothetical protein